MIFTIKPLFVSTLEGKFQGEVEEIVMQVGLDANTTNNLSLSDTQLVFQEK
jgi:hypothetical protein